MHDAKDMHIKTLNIAQKKMLICSNIYTYVEYNRNKFYVNF